MTTKYEMSQHGHRNKPKSRKRGKSVGSRNKLAGSYDVSLTDSIHWEKRETG